MKYSLLFMLIFIASLSYGQVEISGQLLDEFEQPVAYANVVLYRNGSNDIFKVETSNDEGLFRFQNISKDTFYIIATFIGLGDYQSEMFEVKADDVDLGTIVMGSGSVELDAAVIKAKRALVEVKSDRTVFNVEGTINSAGDNALGILRKAPGVMVDNNDNINVLSRSGVLIYVDGKRLPLTGEDLSNYLKNLPAEQIDRMEIITSPGAKYEAEGNAGIIDIRLKRNDNEGANGSVSGNFSRGRYSQGNMNASGNYRNRNLNVFSTVGYQNGTRWNEMNFNNIQNNLRLYETNNFEYYNKGYNYRVGTDFFINNQHTIGFLVNGTTSNGTTTSQNKVEIGPVGTPIVIDSVLIANNLSEEENRQNTYNINYVFNKGEKSLNVDVDYGKFSKDQFYDQPNRYFTQENGEFLSENITAFNTPVDIAIFTTKVDYSRSLLGGKVGIGAKYSDVNTDNVFLFYNVIEGNDILNNTRSNTFDYTEKVLAGYIDYNTQINEKWTTNAGLRVESTNSEGNLVAFDTLKNEPPVILEYTNYFPSFGVSYNLKPGNSFNFNFGRRINRPDYNVLNPFIIQLSEVSFSKGNPFLNPEIVNNFEIGYTHKYMYNLKLSYSKTTNQITRLISPDEEDPRAGFITWDNLANQTILGMNFSAPITINNWWNLFVNFNAGYVDNQADYGGGAVVDVQAFTYTIYQQQTFSLPKGFNLELSGYYSGPGVWGGVFEYEPSFAINLGVQKKFLNDDLNVRLSINDIFFESGWEGISNFNGLVGEGMGNYDSRRAALAISYNFGNKKIKSRKRETGLEKESKRVGQ